MNETQNIKNLSIKLSIDIFSTTHKSASPEDVLEFAKVIYAWVNE